MGGVLLLMGFLACGVAVADGLLPGRQRLTRLWLGLCAGLMLMMWLPTLFAFFLRFTAAASLLGLGAAALLAGAAQFFTRKAPRRRSWTDMPPWLPMALVFPLALLGGALQYTHILRPENGALNSDVMAPTGSAEPLPRLRERLSATSRSRLPHSADTGSVTR